VASNYVRALLIYLAIEKHRPHRREILAEMLWPEKPEGVARNSLKQALSNLRKALGDRDNSEPFLLISRDEIQINQSSPYWIDTVEFSQLIEYVDGHTHNDLMACNTCENKLSQAVEKYRGEFLEEFYLPDNQEFNDWIIIKREVFQRQMSDVLGKLALIYETQKDYEPAIDYCRQLVDLEPWSEQNHRNLMRLLALNGMRSAALRQYQVCRDNLQDELGVEPSTTTVSLYEKIKNWEPGTFPDDQLSVSLGEPNSLQNQEAQVTKKNTKPGKLSLSNINKVSLIVIIGLLGVSLIYWLSTRSPFRSPIPMDPEISSAPSEIEGNQSVALQSTETTAPKQASTSSSVLSNPGSELQVLIALYEKTDGPDWENSEGWLSDHSYCDWYGITCRGGKIVELELADNQLTGTIPTEIGQLAYLENLDF
jgi:DNA-binding SARP family transcriptional activator